ncbi:Uncharacterised protein [Yersinia enterocolitica]|nr:Uncharacterised protein [Yersinia enterocolitica]
MIRTGVAGLQRLYIGEYVITVCRFLCTACIRGLSLEIGNYCTLSLIFKQAYL